MIIGVDAGALSITDDRLKVGVYRVSYHLLKEISHIDTQNIYRLYSFKPIDREVMKMFGSNMKNVVRRPSTGWMSVRLPLELLLRPADVFLGLSQALPSNKSYNIGFVHDIGFMHHRYAYPDSYDHLKTLSRQLTKRANHIVTFSQSTSGDLQKFYSYPGHQISVIPEGVDEVFKVKGRGYKNQYPYFLFVGALKRGKNIPLALRAFAGFLKKTKKKFSFIIVGGDYWLDPDIDQTIKQYRLQDYVRLTGFLNDNTLASCYRGALALINSSLWEGFGLPLVEAMACGCPVITTRAGSTPEVVGEAGILIDQNNDAQLLQAMISLAKNSALRASLIEKGLTRSALFSWKIFARNVYKIIERV